MNNSVDMSQCGVFCDQTSFGPAVKRELEREYKGLGRTLVMFWLAWAGLWLAFYALFRAGGL